MKNKKGFTLVELLAVIVVLALIMIIAIPAVLERINTVKKKSFVVYANKVYDAAEKKILKDMLTNQGDTLNKYNIATDLGITDTGNYQGYVVTATCDKKRIIKLYMWDDNYEVIDKTIGEITEPDNVEDDIAVKVDNILTNNVTNCYSFNDYNINLNYEGGLPADVTSLTVKGNYPITGLPAPSKSGYLFKGWYDSTIQYKNNDLLTNFSLTELTAVYDACPRGYTCANNQSTLNKYICSAGTYLKADTLGCTTCPAGSYCVGGTFSYNETSNQGITACASGYTSSAGSSSANDCRALSYNATKHDMVDVYEYGAGWDVERWEDNGYSYRGYIQCWDGTTCMWYEHTNLNIPYNSSSGGGSERVIDSCDRIYCPPKPGLDCPSGTTNVNGECYSCPNGGTLNTTTHMCEF